MRAKAGFTLIELLIAMAIFAIAGVAVMRATTEHIRAQTMIEEMTLAGFVAENQLQLARLQQNWPPQAQEEGQAEMGRQQWRWVIESTETEDPEFRQLKATVRPLNEPERVVVTLQTFIGRQRSD